MSLSKSLQRCSNGVYYLCVFIPTALILQFGRKEITRSLGTTCHSHVERLAITMRLRIYGLINMAENNSQLGIDELRQMAQRHYDRMVEVSEITVLVVIENTKGIDTLIDSKPNKISIGYDEDNSEVKSFFYNIVEFIRSNIRSYPTWSQTRAQSGYQPCPCSSEVTGAASHTV